MEHKQGNKVLMGDFYNYIAFSHYDDRGRPCTPWRKCTIPRLCERGKVYVRKVKHVSFGYRGRLAVYRHEFATEQKAAREILRQELSHG